MTRYLIPAETVRVETEVSRSRFIATLGMAETAEAARAFIAGVRAEMPDASHHVYAFRAGYGASVTEGLSDDGEPSGTSGPPIMAVLRGSPVGDIVLVVTRYFGGTKLGTGGLVRAYGDAARAAIAALKTIEKIQMSRLRVVLPYNYYERIKILVGKHHAIIDLEEFAADVTLEVTVPAESVAQFGAALREMSAGRITPTAIP